MYINPEAKTFGEITELTPESEAHFMALVDKSKVIVRGSEDELRKLQEDLRKASYRKMH